MLGVLDNKILWTGPEVEFKLKKIFQMCQYLLFILVKSENYKNVCPFLTVRNLYTAKLKV
jgi:hypothetical protein